MQFRQIIKNQCLQLARVSILLRYPYLLTNQILQLYSIPVLLYHKIIEHDDLTLNLPCAVSGSLFNKQMSYLFENGYNVISIDKYLRYISGGEKIPKKTILITFDDGYRNIRSLAYPVLKKYSFPAVVFVSCQYIGTNEAFPWDRKISMASKKISNGLLPLAWEEIREMQDLISVGSHTISHPHLGRLNRKQIYYELSESKELIKQRLIKEIISFAYPHGIKQYGDFNELTRQILIDTGYKVAFNSEIGRNKKASDLYLQKRIGIDAWDSIPLFKSKLVGAYDWVRTAQWFFQKMLKDSSAHL